MRFYSYNSAFKDVFRFDSEDYGVFKFYRDIRCIETKTINSTLEEFVEKLKKQKTPYVINNMIVTDLLINHCEQIVHSNESDVKQSVLEINAIADDFIERSNNGYIHSKNTFKSKFNGFKKHIFTSGEKMNFYDTIYEEEKNTRYR